MDDNAPVRVKDTRVYLAGNAGGFDVRDCPDPEVLAAKIGTALNAHDALVAALSLVKSMRTIDALSPAEHQFEVNKRRKAWAKIDSEIDAALALARSSRP